MTTTYRTKLELLKVDVLTAIALKFVLGTTLIAFFDLSEEDWDEDDEKSEEFFNLPCEFYWDDYAGMYRIHAIEMIDGKLVFHGYDHENGYAMKFEQHVVSYDTLCEIADLIA